MWWGTAWGDQGECAARGNESGSKPCRATGTVGLTCFTHVWTGSCPPTHTHTTTHNHTHTPVLFQLYRGQRLLTHRNMMADLKVPICPALTSCQRSWEVLEEIQGMHLVQNTDVFTVHGLSLSTPTVWICTYFYINFSGASGDTVPLPVSEYLLIFLQM